MEEGDLLPIGYIEETVSDVVSSNNLSNSRHVHARYDQGYTSAMTSEDVSCVVTGARMK
jgi:hypothetical protein